MVNEKKSEKRKKVREREYVRGLEEQERERVVEKDNEREKRRL